MVAMIIYTNVKVVLRFSNFKNSPKSSLKKRGLKG